VAVLFFFRAQVRGFHNVTAAARIDEIAAPVAEDPILAVTRENDVDSFARIDPVVAVPRADTVGARQPADGVVATMTIDGVRAVALGGNKKFFASDDNIVIRRAVDELSGTLNRSIDSSLLN
jgi:hypothetical protein